MQHFDIDIILPCYNPSPNWAQIIVNSLLRLEQLLAGAQIRLIIVNDGSSVNSILSEGVEYLKSQIPNLYYIAYPTNKGKGFALRKGVSEASSPYIITTDVDFPYSEEDVASIYFRLKNGEADIICGVRDSFYYRDVPDARRKISKYLRLFNHRLLNLKITDTQCGLKGFNKGGKKQFLETTINRYLFDLEFIYLASNNTLLRLDEQKVNLKPHVVFSKMNFKILFKESCNFLKILSRSLLIVL